MKNDLRGEVMALIAAIATLIYAFVGNLEMVRILMTVTIVVLLVNILSAISPRVLTYIVNKPKKEKEVIVDERGSVSSDKRVDELAEEEQRIT